MNKFYQKNIWWTGEVKFHVDPPPIPLIKSSIFSKTERDYEKIKWRKNHTPEKSDVYEFKIALFENVGPVQG